MYFMCSVFQAVVVYITFLLSLQLAWNLTDGKKKNVPRTKFSQKKNRKMQGGLRRVKQVSCGESFVSGSVWTTREPFTAQP